MEVTDRLAKIYKQVKSLQEENTRLSTDNENLRSENEELEAELKSLRNRIEELEQKNLNLQVSKAISQTEVDPQAIKAQIDQYVKDIDYCLELLKMR